MAAIFGVLQKRAIQAFNPGVVLSTLQARLAHRAPDGFTVWNSAEMLLGHGALIVDRQLPRVAQPLRLADGRLLLADAFVANYWELHRKLGVGRDSVIDDAQLLALSIERPD